MPSFSTEFQATVATTFQGNSQTRAVQPAGSHFRPQPFEGKMTVEEFQQHMAGDICYGFYLLDDKDRVRVSCVDFDNHPDNPDDQWQSKTEKVYYVLQQWEIPCYVEISSSGSGSHLWIVFDEPTEAWIPRAFWRSVSDELELAMPEIYPRQDRRKKGLGNLVRIPGHNQSRFVDVEEEWVDAEPVFETVAAEDLKLASARLGRKLEPQSVSVRDDGLPTNFVRDINRHPSSLMARRWRRELDGLNDQSNSACIQSLCTAMVEAFYHPEEIDAVIQAFGHKFDYDKCDREDFRQRSIMKAYSYKQTPKQRTGGRCKTLIECALNAVAEGNNRPYLGFGVPAVDASIQGISTGEMGIVFARPGHGKSCISMQWADQAMAQGHRVLMLNAEMNANSMGERYALRKIGLGREQWAGNEEMVKSELEKLRQSGFDPSPRFMMVSTIDDVETEIRAQKSEYGITGVVIDYVQTIQNPKVSRYEAITDNSQRIKALALENDVAILLLAQASRQIEQRGQIEFLTSDLKESGSLEQDADLIAGLYWWGRGTNDSMPPNRADLHLIKRRNGPIHQSMVSMLFDAPRQTYSDWF